MNTLTNIIRKLWEQIDADPYNFRFDIAEVIALLGINDVIAMTDQLSRSLLVNEYQRVISDVQTNMYLEEAIQRGAYVSQNGLDFQKKIETLKNLINSYNDWKNEI